MKLLTNHLIGYSKGVHSFTYCKRPTIGCKKLLSKNMLKPLVPSSKDAQEAVANLQAASQEQVLAAAKELLEWLEDGNWPVSYPVGSVLSQYVNQLQDELLPILRGPDPLWKMWCIRFLLAEASLAQLDRQYVVELERIAIYPTAAEQAEGTAEAAQEALADWRTRQKRPSTADAAQKDHASEVPKKG